MTAEQDRAEVAASRWFHAIDFGEFASQGRFKPGTPQNITLYGAMEILRSLDLSGKSFLDIGCADGLMSFGVKKLGAERVVAIDSYEQKTFHLARRLTGQDVDYRPGVQIKDAVGILGQAQFDVILCAGVIYHMLNPTTAFIECRKLIKEGGIMIMESPIKAGDEPKMILNSESEDRINEIFTYWVPTQSCMTGLMKLVGFDIIGLRLLHRPPRMTVVGRATPLDSIRNRSAMLEKMHARDFCDFELQHSKLKREPSVEITYEADPFERVIVADNEVVDFPYHPKTLDGLGTTKWLRPEGNF